MKTTPTHYFLLALALAAVALPSFAAEPVNIAQAATTTIKSYNANNEDLNGGGFHGTAPLGNLFNGNLTDGTRANNGVSYVVLDFGGDYFITTIDVTKLYRYKYSLYYSSNGTDWTAVPYAVSVSRGGTKKWGVYSVATHVKFVFEKGSFIPDVSEVQVWGIPVPEMECTHSSLSAWAEVPGSATCTSPSQERAACLSCGQVFMRESDGDPLGHDYKVKVTEVGKGHFSCRRCDSKIDCSSGPIELVSLGGIEFDKYVQFTDVSVSSYLGWYEDSGNGSQNLCDGNLGTDWAGGSWQGGSADYIDVKFGAPVLLDRVEVRLPNQDTLRIYKLEGNAETQVFEKEMTSAPETIVAEFDNLVADAIRIRAFNGRWSYMYVGEVRVYGTVPGDVTPEPCFIFMQ